MTFDPLQTSLLTHPCHNDGVSHGKRNHLHDPSRRARERIQSGTKRGAPTGLLPPVSIMNSVNHRLGLYVLLQMRLIKGDTKVFP